VDLLTHVLTAALWTEPIIAASGSEEVRPRWRQRMAVALGASLPDLDGCLGWVSQSTTGDFALYTKYHRVVTHSIGGLLLVALGAALLARHWPGRWWLPSMRRRWRTDAPEISPSALGPLFFLALWAAAWHFAGDAVTAWGTLRPFWPFSDWNAQWAFMNSLEPAMLGLTLAAWAVQQFLLGKDSRTGAWGMAGFWLVACVAYAVFRPQFQAMPYT
jgi:hypothetical protein